MICNTIGLTADSFESIYTTGGTEVEEVYGAIDYAQPIYAKIREMTGTSPLTFTSRVAGTLTDYRIYGETLQDGTPSPDMPVDVVGCGERTENLWNGTEDVTERTYEIEPNTTYVLGKYPPLGDKSVWITLTIYDSDMNQLWSNYAYIGLSVASPSNLSNAKYAKVTVSKSPFTSYFFGKTGYKYAKYIPYGYKLPLTVNGTEYPIYLGQVPTTRRIKKLVLTGEESYEYQPQYSRYVFVLQNAFSDGLRKTECFCTHYQCVHNGAAIENVPDKSIYINSQALGAQFCIKDTEITSLADFQSYLAAQYAAGTPVMIWYVLAEPETGIVNEPLHRIGDYADIISFAQAGVTIPTVSGANVLDITSTVKPSQMYIKGKIKPDGYGELVDSQNVSINDSTGEPINVHGQS